MPYKFGDAVVLVQKSLDNGVEVIRRVNAFVITSTIQPKDATRANGLRDNKGGVLPEGEYLDLAAPRPFAEGFIPKSREMDTLFCPWYSVGPWTDGSWKGWQPGSATAVVPEPAPAQPSEADLDAVAAEQKAAEETTGSPTGKKNRWGK